MTDEIQTATLVVEEGNSPILKMTVRDPITGNYVNDATVVVTVRDLARVPVAGETWPLSMAYQSDSNGVYLGRLEDDVAMLTGLTYQAEFDVTAGGITKHYYQNIYVVKPTTTPPALSTNPASPVYVAKSLQQRLNEAREAYHQVMMGGVVTVVVDQNGERVEYAAQNRAALAAYIYSLQLQLGQIPGGPMGVMFSL